MRELNAAFLWLALVPVALGSCSSAPTPSVWKEEAYIGGPVKKVFIIGAFSEAGIRKAVENEFVLQIGTHGTEAVSGHTVLSPVTVERYDAVQSIVREQGCDAVILVRSPGRSGTGTPFPRSSGAAGRTLSDQWQEYYLKGFPEMPAYSWQEERYRVEADLFETGTGRSVWRATFDLPVQGPAVREVVPLVRVMVNRLRSDRMVR